MKLLVFLLLVIAVYAQDACDYENSQPICEWKENKIPWPTCPYGTELKVVAFWGRKKDDTTTCVEDVPSGYLTETDCPGDIAAATAAVIAQCTGSGGGFCTVKARNNKLGGDPCPGIFKYLKVCTKCEPVKCKPMTLTCEWKYRTFNWRCANGAKPKVQATWGRDPGDNSTCVEGVPYQYLQDLNCPPVDVSQAFADWCDANKDPITGECTIRAANLKLGGDPCRGTFKYMRACVYCDECEDQTLTCEWKYRQFKWSCPAGKRPRATVFWGRDAHDNSTCVEGVPYEYLQNLDCPSNTVVASKEFEDWCNLHAQGGWCTIRASNRKLGGDPCRGTFKYMRVCTWCEDECQPQTLTCEWKYRKFKWSCPAGKRPRAKVTWGRVPGDNSTCVEGVPYPYLQNLNCTPVDVSQAFEDWCNGHSSGGWCTIRASNRKLGIDPCRGTFKYMRACIYCEDECQPMTLTCEWKYRTFNWSCPAGSTPKADVFWGRDKGDNDTCVEGVPPPYLDNLDCPSDNATASQAFEDWCNGHTVDGKCTIRAANRKLGGDPCKGTFKYMRACTYCEHCHPRTLTCEWKYRTFNWSCPAGQRPRAEVFWGRDKGDNDTCVEGVPPNYLRNLDCPSNSAVASKAFENWCNKNAVNGECTIRAANRKLGGDPCRGTFKYMRVCTYCEDICLPKTLTCEWKYRTFNWKCDDGFVPKAIATWGREKDDNSTCVEDVPWTYLQNLNCPPVDVSNAFEEWCNKQPKTGQCTIRASNNKLGVDPCKGTFKYMRACTFCTPGCDPMAGPVTCEWKIREFNWQCPKGKTPIASAFWGRMPGDNTTCTEGVDPKFLQNLDCPGDKALASQAVQHWCNENHSGGKCAVKASYFKLQLNDKNYDPCIGTFKYLYVCTYCKPIGKRTLILLDFSGSMKTAMTILQTFLTEFFAHTSTNAFWAEHLTYLEIIPFNDRLMLDKKKTLDYCHWANAQQFQLGAAAQIEDIKEYFGAMAPGGLTDIGQAILDMLGNPQYKKEDVCMVYIVSDFIDPHFEKLRDSADLTSPDYHMFPILTKNSLDGFPRYVDVKGKTTDDIGNIMPFPIPFANFYAAADC